MYRFLIARSLPLPLLLYARAGSEAPRGSEISACVREIFNYLAARLFDAGYPLLTLIVTGSFEVSLPFEKGTCLKDLVCTIRAFDKRNKRAKFTSASFGFFETIANDTLSSP